MARFRRKIPYKLSEEDFLGEGVTGVVYRLSARRVVKVFRKKFERWEDEMILDEMAQSKKLGSVAAQCLGLCRVILPDGRNARGIIKQYLPYEVTEEEADNFRDEHGLHDYDSKAANMRKSARGIVYFIDPQDIIFDKNSPVWHLVKDYVYVGYTSEESEEGIKDV